MWERQGGDRGKERGEAGHWEVGCRDERQGGRENSAMTWYTPRGGTSGRTGGRGGLGSGREARERGAGAWERGIVEEAASLGRELTPAWRQREPAAT